MFALWSNAIKTAPRWLTAGGAKGDEPVETAAFARGIAGSRSSSRFLCLGNMPANPYLLMRDKQHNRCGKMIFLNEETEPPQVLRPRPRTWRAFLRASAN